MLLSAFIEEAQKLGARTQIIDVGEKRIQPCRELKVCETKGHCPLQDDMQTDIYPLLWQADLIVMATPVFFYSVPAQLKALIDRAQTQWARKYCLGLEDPGRKWRGGFVLAVGATKGENLFQGLNLTAKYFFDAVGATLKGTLSYRKIERIGDIAGHPTALAEAREKARELLLPLAGREKVLFLCRQNACRSQMAQAFTQYYAGDRVEALCAGDSPAEKVSDLMVQVMAERGLDMAFRKPRSMPDVVTSWLPDSLITMGCNVSCPTLPGVKTIDWDLPDPAGQPIAFLRDVRDEIEKKVKETFHPIDVHPGY